MTTTNSVSEFSNNFVYEFTTRARICSRSGACIVRETVTQR